ncbi:hypothetical protein FACS1894142_2970 [Spirochaetia bacterium]|nr:hypothetical protein FACS1894142_2970 [Spirochaetia bacterium]
MPISLEKFHHLREVDTSNVTLDAIPETYIHREIGSLGKAAFALDELKRWDFMDGYGNFDAEVTVEEITNHIWALRDQFKKEHAESFFNEQKDTLIHTVVDRFALGGVMAKGDKTGGNVDTVHNVRQKDANGENIYATEQERQRYNNNPNYNSDDYHGNDKKYRETKAKGEAAFDAGTLKDGYTGEKFKPDQEHDLEHMVSANEIHNDPGRILAELDGVELANSDDNLTFIDGSVNSSKQDKTADEYIDYLNRTREKRQRTIKRLSEKKDLTDNEKKALKKLEKLEALDTEKIKAVTRKAEKAYNGKINKKYYTSKKFIKNTAITSATEGAKMGGRQMIGAFIREIITAVFDEIRDCISRVKKLGEKWYNGLLARLKRIGAKVVGKWKQILEEGATGFISGFCSNIVTVIINIFVTTAKNIVRLIREGFFSVVKAIKMLINPPADMPKSQLFHEVGKIIITGSIITFGILAEEAIDKFPPMAVIKRIPVIGELLTDVILGLLIALVTALALWGWDKLDIFGYKKEIQHKFVMDTLERERQEADDRYKEWLETIKQTDEQRYALLCSEFGLA